MQYLAKETGGGNPSRADFTYCGDVTNSQRAQLVKEGYKNTAYDGIGNIQKMGTLKSGPLAWVCRVDTKAVEKQLKSKLGSGVKLKCKTKNYKSGTVTVICQGAKRTYTVKPPVHRAPIGKDCTNPQAKGNSTTSESSISNLWTAWSTIQVKKGETIVCPGGASATATASAYARGFGYGKTLGAAKNMAKKNAKAKVTTSGKCGVFTPPIVVPPTCQQLGNCPVPPGPSLTCPTGYALNSQGICVQIVVGCSAGQVKDAMGNCVTQTNTAEQNCRSKGGSWDSVQLTCTIIQVNGNCSNIIVINGDNNVVSNTQQGNCNITQPPCSSCNQPPPASAMCTGLNVQNDLQVAKGIIATVTYSATNATLKSIVYNWGDGSTTTTTSTTQKHTFSVANTYQVYASLTFSTANGDITSTCATQTVTPKDGTEGAGSGTPGTGGGTGSGGSPGDPTTGSTCRDPNTGDIVPGEHDQFGYCV
jgi:hypothetical protein